MCYWELSIAKKNRLKVLKVQSQRNDDGFGLYCLQCNTILKTENYKQFVNVYKQHYGHAVLVHFRLRSTGHVTLNNIQPIVYSDTITAHNGDFSKFAYRADYKELLSDGLSDSNVLSYLLHDAFYTKNVKDSKVDEIDRVFNLLSDVAEYDFIGNYVFITPDFVFVQIHSGSFENDIISTAGSNSIQLLFFRSDIESKSFIPFEIKFIKEEPVNIFEIDDEYDSNKIATLSFSNDEYINEYIINYFKYSKKVFTQAELNSAIQEMMDDMFFEYTNVGINLPYYVRLENDVL